MNQRYFTPLICLLLTAYLAACTYRMETLPVQVSPPAPTILTSPPSTPTANNPSNATLPPPQVQAAPSPTPEDTPVGRTRYTLQAVLDYDQHHLAVTEIISYTNRTGTALDDLVILIEPNRYTGVFKLNQVGWGNGQTASAYTLDGNQMSLPLPEELEREGTITISLEYELFLPSPTPNPFTRPVPFGYTTRQTNLVDWYPFIAPYVPGKGWLAHQAGYFGEHLAYESSDFDVQIQVKDKAMVNPLETTNQPVFTIAASSPAIQDGDGLRYQFSNARNFVWSASHAYVVTSQKVGDTTIYGYAFPAHRAAGEAVLDTTASSLALYNDLFGIYPHSSLSVVEADFLDGMEYDGLYFLSHGFYNLYGGTPAEYLIVIAAHETAHQWWYGMVGNDQALDPWLDEALCTYSERLFYENLYPEALDWWWTYRIHYYQPQGKIDGSIYSYTTTADAYRSYRDAVYLNGALFFEDLRQLVGDQAFFNFLKDYSNQHYGKIATGESFFRILSTHTDKNIEPLLEKFFLLSELYNTFN